MLQVKQLKKFAALYIDENKFYFNEGSCDAVFIYNGMGILNIDLKNINLDNNFVKNDSDTIIVIRLLAFHIKFEKCKELKELMPVAWHS